MIQVLLGILVLSFLVLLHELGHFIAAKLVKIPVLKFSIGFGKPIISKKIGETEYQIAPILFGGFVQMEGDEPGKTTADGFNSRPIWQRAFVAVSGPLVNLVTAFIFLVIMYLHGVPNATYLDHTNIGFITPHSAADGYLQAGDSVISINGEVVSNWQDLDLALKDLSSSHAILFVRNGKKDSVTFKISIPDPNKIDEFDHGLLPLLPAVIGSIGPDSPAKNAGLVEGDTIISISGLPIVSWYDISPSIEKLCTPESNSVTMIIKNGTEKSVVVSPKFTPLETPKKKWGKKESENDSLPKGRYIAGIGPRTEQYIRKLPFSDSIEKSVDTWKKYFFMIFDVFGKLFSGEVQVGHLSGPISIIMISGTAAQAGIAALLNFMALISVNLGVLNLMPLVITDGGILALLLVEFIIRKPVPEKVHQVLASTFTALFLLLFIFISFYDVIRIPMFMTP